MLRGAVLLVMLVGTGAVSAVAEESDAALQVGQALKPKLGIYVDVDREKWGADQVNLRIVNNNFQLFFLDADGLLVDSKADDVIIHYGNFIKDSNAKETVLLEPDGLMYTRARVISPPHRYQVRIFLRKTVDPEPYYKEKYEEKEFIGMHVLNQLGGAELYEKTHTTPTSVEVEIIEENEQGEREVREKVHDEAVARVQAEEQAEAAQ